MLQTLIAHYLAENYPAALDAFLQAAHVPPPDLAHPPRVDLETLVADYRSYELARELESVTIDEPVQGSQSLKDLVDRELPRDVSLGGVVRTIEGVSAANLLTVWCGPVPKRDFDLATASYRASYPMSIITTSVDRSLRVLDYASGEVDRLIEPHRAAILSFALHPTNPRYLLTGSMDGTTVLTDLITAQSLQTFRSNKFVVRVAFSPDGQYMATASYDRAIVVYRACPLAGDVDVDILDDTDDPLLASEPNLRYEEVHRVKVDTNPEALLFHPDYLMYTVRASHMLYYLVLPGGGDAWTIKHKSFNPHPLDTHVSFSVLHLALHPSGRIVACQTGDHAGGAGERILLYGVEPDETDRLACLWTGGETDDFCLPRMAWLPDGSGLITTSPNGYLHLVSLSGETRSSVKIHGASDLGQASSEVVRDCCIMQKGNDWEVVSVGYDRRIRISR